MKQFIFYSHTPLQIDFIIKSYFLQTIVLRYQRYVVYYRHSTNNQSHGKKKNRTQSKQIKEASSQDKEASRSKESIACKKDSKEGIEEGCNEKSSKEEGITIQKRSDLRSLRFCIVMPSMHSPMAS
jgi:hypothetical protein